MRFSVIIPTYNRQELLRQALDSVWAQTFTDYEVIVVDDGSADGTLDYLNSLGDRVQVLRQANQGPGAARNLGLSIARGDYIAFLDSDDLWFPWSLTIYARVIEQNGAPSFIAGKPKVFLDYADLGSIAEELLDLLKFQDYLASGDEWRWFGVSSFVVNRQALLHVGGFTNDRVNGEDADLALRLGVSSGFVQICSPPTFGYRSHTGNITKDTQKSLAGFRRMIQEEQSGNYPGGPARSCERWRIITRHVRPTMVSCLQQRMNREAWSLYGKTFGWHLLLGRWKCLLGFPAQAVVIELRQLISARRFLD